MRKAAIAIILLVAMASAFAWQHIGARRGAPEIPSMSASTSREAIGYAGNVELTVVYDNNPYDPRLKAAWGFACYIETDTAKILFDTGGDPRTLLDNMEKLSISPQEIETIILSHIHSDHVGGLFGILERNRDVDVYVPASFPDDLKSRVRSFDSRLVEVERPLKICEGVMTTGELGSVIKEQSLIVNSSKGLIVVTGCAHPGIAFIVEEAVELTDEEVYLVIGGFHLSGSSEEEIGSIIDRFRSLNLTKVAPCHCSGDLARRMLKCSFQTGYIEAGVGTNLRIERQAARV